VSNHQFTNQSLEYIRKKFLSLCSIVKTTEWNGLIKIDNEAKMASFPDTHPGVFGLSGNL
jgi:hypothetical protein